MADLLTAARQQPRAGVLIGVLVALAALLAGTTTSARAAPSVYDGLALTHIDTREDTAAGTGTVLLSAARERSVSPRAELGGALMTLAAAVNATNTATSSIDDLLRPGGSLIGKAGTDACIREITGGLSDAQVMFQQLSRGGTIVEQTATLTRVQLLNGGFVQLRTVMARSPGTAATIDVNISGLDITKLKFNP